jgi:flavin reductase (DIM6/NTAB) family NADH-FMN oxidoreductase RutF
MSDDTRALRNALGCFATGVCLITVRDADGRALAMTANSFASVSLDPPLVLWSLQRGSLAFEHFAYPPHFAINVLAREQEALSSRYATRGGHLMDAGHHVPGENGAPLVPDALAAFECSLQTTYDGGDHLIILGRVSRFLQRAQGGLPLLFYGGAYGSLTAEAGA